MGSANPLRSDAASLPPFSEWQQFDRNIHDVQFYSDENFLLDQLSRYFGTALGAGDAAIMFCTPAHRQGILQALRDHGLDASVAQAQGRLVACDAEEMLARLMVDGRPEPQIFAEFIGQIIRQARASAGGEQARVAVFGEMVALLCAAGQTEAALEVEHLWNELAETHSFSLRCAYPLSLFSREEQGESFLRVCNHHARVIPAEGYLAAASEEERLRGIGYLQQKALALQAVAEERKRLALALSVEVEDLRRLHELTTRVTHLDLKQIMCDVLAAVAALQNTDLGLLSLRDPQKDLLQVGASIGLPPEFLECVAGVPPGGGSCGTSMERHERVIVEDVERDPIFRDYLKAAQVGGFRAVHSTPLLDRSGNVVGVLSVHFRRPYRPSDREIRLTDLYAQLAVNAIENARLFAEAQQEIQRRKQAEEALKDRLAELKRAHTALMEAEKLAATGRLAATIAHELNNPLEGIINLFYLLKHSPCLDQEALGYAQMCEQELERVSHIVRQTLGFYRNHGKPAPVGVAEVVRDVLALKSKAIEVRNVDTGLELDDQQRIIAHEGEVRQVVLNLLGNALHAMPDGGRLHVRVRAATDWRNPALHGVRITIADTGTGIAKAHRARMFEPFFSTKDERGTGLGLWVTKGIVQKHEGSIRFRSRRGLQSGTCFSVFLPAAPRQEIGAAPARSSATVLELSAGSLAG